MKKALSLSLLVATMLTSAHAQNQFTLESIDVVAAHGTSVKKKDLTDSVTIITKEALEETRITNLAEALSKLGNLTVSQTGGLGQQTSVFVRGMDSKRTLVLIDGVRYNDPRGFGAQFDQIMLFNVEQIEIIKGAQSGIWGADASAGVINIITQKGKKGFNAAANLEYGSFETKTISLQTSYGNEDFDILVGGSLLHTDGFSAAEPKKGDPDYGKRYDKLEFDKDRYRNKSFNAKLGINITENDRIEFATQIINSDVNFDKGAGSDSPIPNTELTNRFHSFVYKHKDSINDINLQLNRSTFDSTTESVGWLNPIDTSKFQGSVDEIKIDDKISYLTNSFVRFGASYQKFEYENITNNNDKNYNAKSIFITNYNKLELLQNTPTIFTQTVRYDNYSDFKNATTGKVGLKQFLYKDIYISLNGGTGYNAPSLFQLYGLGPNPDLTPEKTRTFDITLGNDVVWATAFRNEIKDLIDFIEYTSKYEQVDGKATFKGFELGYKDIFFNQFGVEALYTYLDTKDKDNKSFARRPKQQLDTKAIWYISDNFDIGANAQYIGKRHDLNSNPIQTGRYIVAGAVANLKTNDYLTVYAKANNITDKYYQVVNGYATEGRSFYVGLNARY